MHGRITERAPGSSLRRLLPALAAAALMISPAPASAAGLMPFGHTCKTQNGVRFCPTTDGAAGQTVNGVPSFDGVPLDVDVTLPASGTGPFPTIVMLHGFGQDKTAFEATSPLGDGNKTYHYNNIFFAQHGYAVVNYTARGFGHSCGGGPSASSNHTGPCAKGYIHLADTRYEARDTQYLLGLLVDEGITKPNAIGVTGISYGGGQSLELAYLKNRVRMPNGQLVPWVSPTKHTPIEITAAYPRWEWSDLLDALLPNGRFLDFKPSTANDSAVPIGVPIQSYLNGLYLLGQVTGFYCGQPPASPCTDPSANLPLDFSEPLKGEPFAEPAAQMLVNDIRHNHQAYGLPLPRGGPAPLLLQNGWTDDLFPPSEALRVYNQLRMIDAKAPVTLQFGDLGHSRGSNKPGADRFFQDQAVRFFDHWLRGTGTAPAPGSVDVFTETCPSTGSNAPPESGPFSASSWKVLHPLTLTFGGSSAQTLTAMGDSKDGPPFDPVPTVDPPGTTDACTTITPPSSTGTAVYTMKSRGFTLLGLPTVHATITTIGLYGELDSRLYDVLPNGTERLITRGTYRLLDNQSGHITFQLHGNGYFFAPGDTVKLELRGNDGDYYRPSNDTAFTVLVSKLRVSLPLPASPLRGGVHPDHATAGKSTHFRFTIKTDANGSTFPVARARISLLGHTAHTNRAGRAHLDLALPHAGTFSVRVSKLGFRTIELPVKSHAARRERRHRGRHHPARQSRAFTG